MSTKKISELSTKSFLGGAGAAANSYVLINYEDNSTSEPITYKATIQELGKAIANDLQLYKKTQEGAVTTSVNNGAYVDGTAKDFIELHTPKNVQMNGAGDLGYFTAADSNSWVSLDTGVSEGYVNAAVSGLASTGYVTNAIANAGGGFDPTTPITCSVVGETITAQESLYPAMIVNDSAVCLYLQSQESAGKFIYGGVIASTSDLDDMAHIGTSDNKPCIRDKNQDFIGFLSTT